MRKHESLCTMPRDRDGASNIGTFACRTFSRDTKASKRAKLGCRIEFETNTMKVEIPKAILTQLEVNLRMSINSKLPTVCKSGYYLASRVIKSFELTSLDKFLDDLTPLVNEEFDSSLKQIIMSNFDEFKEFVFEAIPERQEITKCAFDLYKEGNFIALIPLILSQVDGIMKEITGENGFYASKNDKMKYFKNDLYINFFSTYHQLDVNNRNEYELLREKANPREFNRHAILHGESYTYSNDTNALKAILLLIFIAEIKNANLI
jgi:hypothetical protein